MRRKITAKGILKLLEDIDEAVFPTTRLQAWKNLKNPKYFRVEDYFPSEVKKSTAILLRKGQVEIKNIEGALVVKITEKGKSELLKYRLESFEPKMGIWDGRWRVVFFDVMELERIKRDKLRLCLKKLGLKQMQESVWVSPFDVGREVKYIREVLEIPHGVKLGVMDWIENGEDLKKWFRV